MTHEYDPELLGELPSTDNESLVDEGRAAVRGVVLRANYIMVEKIPPRENTTRGGIITPASDQGMVIPACVLAVGPDVAEDIKPGLTILIAKPAGLGLAVNGYYGVALMKDDNVLAIDPESSLGESPIAVEQPAV